MDGDINTTGSYLTNGADYAEYFKAEEALEPGDLVGLNSVSGLARAYQPGDALIGIVSTSPGVVGNSELSSDEQAVLVALVGQVPFKKDQVSVKGGRLLTLDQKPIERMLQK